MMSMWRSAGRWRAWAGLSLLFCGVSPSAPAAEATPWAAGRHSAVRLLDGGLTVANGRLAGVELRLDAGFITYWRSAGEAGVAPVFDFSGSTNVRAAKVDYPAPRLIDEDGIEAYGYEAGVTFPVEVTPADPSVPVRLDLTLDYAICSKLCLPAKAHVALTLDETGSNDADRVRAARDDVPKPAGLGGTAPVRIDAVTWTGPTTLSVIAAVPDGRATLFVEAPEPWYFSASPARVEGDGHLGFALIGPDHSPPPPLPAGPLRLTLVSVAGSIEVALRLDAVAAKP